MVGVRTGAGRAWARAVVVAAAGLSLAACATNRMTAGAPTGAWGVNGTMRPYEVKGIHYTPSPQPHYDKVGLASWYGQQLHHHTTADGEAFDMDVASAAHTTLPLPSLVEVTNLDNGRRISVRVNDRGPFVSGRIIDLSRQGAKDLGFYDKGMVRVRVRYIGPAPLAAPGPVYARARVAPSQPPIVIAARPAFGAVRIQAGAFSERANAERAAALLSAEGSASIEPLDRGGVVVYRVLVTCTRGEDAQSVRDRVVAAGFPGAKVTPAF
jgi:rare lipoprotein A